MLRSDSVARLGIAASISLIRTPGQLMISTCNAVHRRFGWGHADTTGLGTNKMSILPGMQTRHNFGARMTICTTYYDGEEAELP